jgi:hypothetical protein
MNQPYGLSYWESGEDCDPPEPNKEWISIGIVDPEHGMFEELAVVVLRNRAYFEKNQPEVVKYKIETAQFIVDALNAYMQKSGEKHAT